MKQLKGYNAVCVLQFCTGGRLCRQNLMKLVFHQKVLNKLVTDHQHPADVIIQCVLYSVSEKSSPNQIDYLLQFE